MLSMHMFYISFWVKDEAMSVRLGFLFLRYFVMTHVWIEESFEVKSDDP